MSFHEPNTETFFVPPRPEKDRDCETASEWNNFACSIFCSGRQRCGCSRVLSAVEHSGVDGKQSSSEFLSGPSVNRNKARNSLTSLMAADVASRSTSVERGVHAYPAEALGGIQGTRTGDERIYRSGAVLTTLKRGCQNFTHSAAPREIMLKLDRVLDRKEEEILTDAINAPLMWLADIEHGETPSWLPRQMDILGRVR